VGELLAGKVSDLIGVSHGDDILLVYSLDPLLHKLSEGEKAMQTHLLDMYESFTATGTPTFKSVDLARARDKKLLTYTQIDGPDNVTVTKNDNFGKHKFWDTIAFNEH